MSSPSSVAGLGTLAVCRHHAMFRIQSDTVTDFAVYLNPKGSLSHLVKPEVTRLHRWRWGDALFSGSLKAFHLACSPVSVLEQKRWKVKNPKDVHLYWTKLDLDHWKPLQTCPSWVSINTRSCYLSLAEPVPERSVSWLLRIHVGAVTRVKRTGLCASNKSPCKYTRRKRAANSDSTNRAWISPCGDYRSCSQMMLKMAVTHMLSRFVTHAVAVRSTTDTLHCLSRLNPEQEMTRAEMAFIIRDKEKQRGILVWGGGWWHAGDSTKIRLTVASCWHIEAAADVNMNMLCIETGSVQPLQMDAVELLMRFMANKSHTHTHTHTASPSLSSQVDCKHRLSSSRR